MNLSVNDPSHPPLPLRPGEVVFWQFDPCKTIAAIAAAVAALALLAFTYRPATDGSSNPILVFLAWGVIAAVVYHARSFWDRRRTFYTLTTQRAFIATWHFGVQTLRAYPIATMRPLRLADTRPGHVWFDHNTERRKDRSTGRWEEHIVEVGFLNLTDPREIHDALVRLGAEPG